MPDFAGAKAAIRSRLEAGWTTTRITYQNETPAAPFPPTGAGAVLVPWVNLEVEGGEAEIVGTGTPGNHVWTYEGTIMVHVFVPIGSGDALATQYAITIGELFRAAQFYDSTPGFAVRTLAPSVDPGGSADDDGLWFRVTMSVDFVYWHRG